MQFSTDVEAKMNAVERLEVSGGLMRVIIAKKSCTGERLLLFVTCVVRSSVICKRKRLPVNQVTRNW